MATSYKHMPFSMAAIAKFVANELNVKVFFDSFGTAYVDPKGIHLPAAIKAVGSEKDAILLNGYLDHEAAHIRFTDLSVMKKVRSAFEKTIFNILEDVRIEDLIGKVFPGCRINLAKASAILDGDVRPKKGTPPDQLITGWLATNMRSAVLQHQCNGAKAFAAEVLKILGKQLFQQIEALAFQASSAHDSESCYQISAKIVDLIKKAQQEQQKKDEAAEAEMQKQQQSQSKSGQGSESNSGQDQDTESDDKGSGSNAQDSNSEDQEYGQSAGSGSGSDDSKDSDSKGSNAQGSGSEDEDSDQGASSGSGSNSDKGQEQSNASSSSNAQGAQTGQDQAGNGQTGAPGASSGSTSGDPTSQEDTVDAQALAQALAGAGTDGFAQAMQNAVTAMMTQYPSERVEPEIISLSAMSGRGKYVSNDANGALRKVAGQLDTLLWSKSNSLPYASTSGKLKPNRLTSVVTMCNTRICDRVDEEDGLDTAVELMVDVSGSMGTMCDGTPRKLAIDCAAVVASITDRFEGIACSVDAFDDYIFPIKSFEDPWSRTGGRAAGSFGQGGTRMGAAHAYAIGKICQRREKRRIMLIATDGCPNNWESLAASVSEANRRGLETRFVLIGTGAKKADFVSKVPAATCVSQATAITALPGAILEALTGGQGIC